MTVDWGSLLVGQLTFYWDVHLRPRLAGLTDDEFFWEPVDGCWSLRPGPDGAYVLDGQSPAPSPAPVTTLAWRIVHVGTGLSTRVSAFFSPSDGTGAMPDGTTMFDPVHLPATLPSNAAEGVAFLEDAYHTWHDAIAGLNDAALARPLGPAGAMFAAEPMAGLIAHLNREVMHHGGEIGVLRDLYRADPGRSSSHL
jgi:hypothetical protein